MDNDELIRNLLSLGNFPSPRRSFIKMPVMFPGSKYESLKYIIDELHIVPTSKWIDVCGGTGVVSMNVPDCALMVYNDINSGVVDFYRAMRDHLDEFVDYLEKMHPWSREEWTIAHETWETEVDPVKRAVLWFYTIRNSLSQVGDCFARAVTRLRRVEISRKMFEYVQVKFKKFMIECLDMNQCIKDFDSPESVFYIDPPYLHNRNPYGTRWSEKHLRTLLDTIKYTQGRVVLSHRPLTLIDESVPWSYTRDWTVLNSPMVHTSVKERVTEKLWVKEAI